LSKEKRREIPLSMDMDKMKEKLTQIDPLATIPALQSE
jgi:hypothetical protein